MTKINKIGGSFKITLPKQICDMLGWQEDQEISIKLDDSKNIIIINTTIQEKKKRSGEHGFFN